MKGMSVNYLCFFMLASVARDMMWNDEACLMYSPLWQKYFCLLCCQINYLIMYMSFVLLRTYHVVGLSNGSVLTYKYEFSYRDLKDAHGQKPGRLHGQIAK